MSESDGTEIRVVFEWPKREVHQNYRPPHWAVKARAVKAARSEAERCCEKQGVPRLHGEESVEMRVEFYPKDRRGRDVQNVIGACKALLDGVSDWIGVDDKRFRVRWPVDFEAPRAAGAQVVIYIKLPAYCRIETQPVPAPAAAPPVGIPMDYTPPWVDRGGG